MRGRVAGALLWCAATAGATLLVQSGVGTIRAATRRDAVVDVQAITVETGHAPADTTSTTARPGAVTTTGPGTSVAPETTATPTTTVRATAAPTTLAPTPTTTIAPVASTVTSIVATITRTIPSRGGTVTVRYQLGEVTVLAATPNPGYSVEVSRGGTRIRVEFEDDDDRQSRIEAWWDGEPRHEVQED